jgi:hypothetical protein
VQLECSQHDLVGQRVSSAVVMLGAAGLRMYPVEIRYAWPAELNIMGSMAGLDGEDRWSGWDRQPFTAASASQVSVWRAPSV